MSILYSGPQITINLRNQPALLLQGSAYTVAVEVDRVHVFYNGVMRWSFTADQVVKVTEDRIMYV